MVRVPGDLQEVLVDQEDVPRALDLKASLEDKDVDREDLLVDLTSLVGLADHLVDKVETSVDLEDLADPNKDLKVDSEVRQLHSKNRLEPNKSKQPKSSTEKLLNWQLK
jgi:hypothetical protein